MNPPTDFAQFLKHRKEVASAYSSGNGTPLDEIVVRSGPASFFPPSGGHVQGAAEVGIRYEVDVRAFSAGSHTHLEILDSGASGDLAYWTGIQTFEGTVGDKPTTMNIRLTELYRREDGQWKLFHRHADPAGTAG